MGIRANGLGKKLFQLAETIDEVNRGPVTKNYKLPFTVPPEEIDPRDQQLPITATAASSHDLRAAERASEDTAITKGEEQLAALYRRRVQLETGDVREVALAQAPLSVVMMFVAGPYHFYDSTNMISHHFNKRMDCPLKRFFCAIYNIRQETERKKKPSSNVSEANTESDDEVIPHETLERCRSSSEDMLTKSRNRIAVQLRGSASLESAPTLALGVNVDLDRLTIPPGSI
jgi:hypothetical protein